MADFGQASKIGFNNNVGTTGFTILSNASVVNPIGTGEQVRIVSTSANDTLLGTGAQKVKITYFDNSWTLKSEIVSLNGLTAVDTVGTDIYRVESFDVIRVGTDLFAAGNITAKSIDGTRLFAQIDSGQNTFNRALHWVRPGKIGNIVDLTTNCPTSGGVIFLAFVTRDNTPDGGGLVLIPDLAFTLAADTIPLQLSIPISCNAVQSTQGLQMGIAVRGLSPNQIATASFHFYEI